ncbi:hypothetical protein WJM97_09400 [Okeanomitos corallinicola TIOX110]|uniref:Uncharacterized protein n=1 Tax=Okeanomitos corallinicola TIOX110 TaxID=3133117 RepID=A0ABZ2UWV9_9CYAN
MKLSHVISLIVGSCTTAILASGLSSAQALEFNFAYSYPSGNASGILTTSDQAVDIGGGDFYYVITSISGQRGANTINRIANGGGSDNLISATAPFHPTERGFSFSTNSLGSGSADGVGVYKVSKQGNSIFEEQLIPPSDPSPVNLVITPVTVVPFNIPGGASIPTIGSLLSIALMGKFKKKRDQKVTEISEKA